jgi:ATP-dependent Clp protease adapter protein ClpS
MVIKTFSLLLSVFFTFQASAFLVPAPSRSFLTSINMAGLSQPDIKIGQKTALVTKQNQKVEIRQKAKTSEPVQNRKDDFMEAPLFKVMLIGDDSYDIGHVMERMCAIMEDMDEDQAKKIFGNAQSMGKAMCGKYPMEHAEMYKEQLLRSEPMIFADIEDENN